MLYFKWIFFPMFYQELHTKSDFGIYIVKAQWSTSKVKLSWISLEFLSQPLNTSHGFLVCFSLETQLSCSDVLYKSFSKLRVALLRPGREEILRFWMFYENIHHGKEVILSWNTEKWIHLLLARVLFTVPTLSGTF